MMTSYNPLIISVLTQAKYLIPVTWCGRSTFDMIYLQAHLYIYYKDKKIADNRASHQPVRSGNMKNTFCSQSCSMTDK